MASIFEFFEKIQSQIQSLQQSIQEIQTSWQKFNEFWDLFFSIVPWEVILLLIFSVILLSLFNSVSPGTPKLNLTASILLLSSSWFYFWSLFSANASVWVVSKSALYLLVPLHFMSICGLLFRFLRKKWEKKSRIQPKDWNLAMQAVSQTFHEFLALAYSTEDLNQDHKKQLELKLLQMEEAISGAKKTISI